MPVAKSDRRRNMQANRRRDTKPEVELRSSLHRRGYRYRCDFVVDLPQGRVRPDIVFTRLKIAIFVDGCFWHLCPDHGSMPTRNQSYWTPKLNRNVKRDRDQSMWLRGAGWKVIRVWEHEGIEDSVERVAAAIEAQKLSL